MAANYPLAFSPIKIGPVEVKNRVYIPAHGVHVLSSGGPNASAVPSADFVHYIETRAAGGVGLMLTPFTSFPKFPQMSAFYEDAVPHWRAVAEAAHRHGAKIMAQITSREGGIPWEPLGAMEPLLGVSEYPFGATSTTLEMPHDMVRQWIEAHGQSARNVRDAGYDGVQVHVTHATTHMTFVSPYYNHRTDEYGGSFENRMRALVETLEEVRRNVSDRMAVGIRLNGNDMQPGGLSAKDSEQVLGRLAELQLIDFVDIDVGEVGFYGGATGYGTPYQRPGYQVDYSEPITKPVKGRVVRMGIGGRITTIAQVEQILAGDRLDMVGAVRGHIAEPNLVKNAMEGREDRSRTCLSCNYCTGAGQGGRVGWGCVINPETGHERRWGKDSWGLSANPSKVVIVGSGAAGLEAARVAAKLGHKVVLFERRDKIGGALNLWGALPGQATLLTTVDWYGRQLEEFGVAVRTGVAATATTVLAERPSAVLLATGSRYDNTGASSFIAQPIAGSQQDFVFTPEQIIEDGVRPNGRVLVLDEERTHAGIGVAEILAQAGAQVELLTSDLSLIPNNLRKEFQWTFYMPKLQSLGVKMSIGTYIKAIGDHRATLYDIITFAEETKPVDAVVLATMRRAERPLAKELEGKVAQLYVIGDALAPRQLFESMYDGQRFARLVGDDQAPRTTEEALAPWVPRPIEVYPKSAATTLKVPVV